MDPLVDIWKNPLSAVLEKKLSLKSRQNRFENTYERARILVKLQASFPKHRKSGLLYRNFSSIFQLSVVSNISRKSFNGFFCNFKKFFQLHSNQLLVET